MNGAQQTRPVRMLHIVAGLDAGGTETWAQRLLEHWHGTMDQDVIALNRTSGVMEPALARFATLRVLSDEMHRTDAAISVFRAIREHVARTRPDAALIYIFGKTQVAAALALRSAGIRRIAASAGNPPPARGAGRVKWGALLAASRVAGCPVAGCSHAVHAELERLGVGLPAGSFPISPGIAIGSISRAVIRQGVTTLGMVSRLDAIKDHATLLQAFAHVASERPELRLVLIGDGPLRPKLEVRAAESDLSGRVHFLGRRTDVAALLETFDAFVFSTTRSEGFGIVLIEAMAAGLPIIASDVPACREVLDDGRAGVLVPAGDPLAMADAIRRLLDDPDCATRYSTAGHERARSTYSVKASADRWLDMLRLRGPLASAA